MIERHTYTITHDVDESRVPSETVEGLVEDLAKSTGAEYTIEQTHVCPDCGWERRVPWPRRRSERRCRPCETLQRAEGRG